MHVALEEQARTSHNSTTQLQQELTRLRRVEEDARVSAARATYAEQQLVKAQEELKQAAQASRTSSAVELDEMSRVCFQCCVCARKDA